MYNVVARAHAIAAWILQQLIIQDTSNIYIQERIQRDYLCTTKNYYKYYNRPLTAIITRKWYLTIG